MSNIKLLSPNLINKIAAGEVIERPASVVKELVENSIDAGSTHIQIYIEKSGRNFISVTDNGPGMSANDLKLAILSHATSKINDENLFLINTLGFRGEALPSIGAVSKLKITSKYGASDAWQIEVIGGKNSDIKPAQLKFGTQVEVRDLFFSTPVRLKFLRSEITEQQEITKMLRKLALINPHIHFTLKTENKLIFDYKENDIHDRISEIMEKKFVENSSLINFERENIKITGYACLPTFSRKGITENYLFVNNRPVKDKFLNIAIKLAYMDLIPRDRYPIVIISLIIPYTEVDVNVHPTKSEVRFKDPNFIRTSIIEAIKSSINNSSQKTSSELSEKLIKKFWTPEISAHKFHLTNHNNFKSRNYSLNYDNLETQTILPLQESEFSEYHHYNNNDLTFETQKESQVIDEQNIGEFLGIPKGQLYKNYIISETEDSLIIIDQHAAHERIIYEEIKHGIAQNGVKKQRLISPLFINLSEEKTEAIISAKENLSKFGFTIGHLSASSFVISEIPLILANINIEELIEDIANELVVNGEETAISEKIKHIFETNACHNSVRTGRQLSITEMDALLRKMEVTPNSGQCNHGRPTFIKLKLSDLENLFGRT